LLKQRVPAQTHPVSHQASRSAPGSGYIDIEKFRHREWTPALRAAGIDHRPVKAMRHTFATWAIEAGVELWYLARIMGTSTTQIEDTTPVAHPH